MPRPQGGTLCLVLSPARLLPLGAGPWGFVDWYREQISSLGPRVLQRPAHTPTCWGRRHFLFPANGLWRASSNSGLRLAAE